MDDDKVTISLRRDAAHYLSMLLGDQLVSLGDTVMNEHILDLTGLPARQSANRACPGDATAAGQSAEFRRLSLKIAPAVAQSGGSISPSLPIVGMI
jgi:hypothetical protein